VVGRRSGELGEGAFLAANGHEVKGGTDAGQANLAVAIGVFSAPREVATVTGFGPVVFHGHGGARFPRDRC